jgi:predicted acetyltransferase
MIRPYEPTDKEHCLRILREVGWMEGKDTDSEVFDGYISDSPSFVTDLNGEVEVLALTRSGLILYQDSDLPICGVTGVLTSRVARMQGHALRTTAHAVANSAAEGASVSFLGIFDQGYYDKLGFGSLNYCRHITIDPSTFKVPKLSRAPKRLTKDDAEAMHHCRLKRKRVHGSCNMFGVGITGCELVWCENGFGLGFENTAGELTHFVWLTSKGEHGPYICRCTAWQTPEQLVELFSVLKSLSDQVHGIRMTDPVGFQLQDFLDRPFKSLSAREGGTFASNTSSNAWMQCRILDISKCFEAMHFRGLPVSFNLEVNDPIEKYLDCDSKWTGTSGSWIVQIGENSSARSGSDDCLPTLRCSINDLSRLWLGVATAESLVTVGNLQADHDLISKIDALIQLPQPNVDWDF